MNQLLNGWEKVKNEYKEKEIKIDLLIVLAGGLNEEGKVHEWVKRRLDRAIEIHKIFNCPILCSGGGTYHKPPYYNDEKFVVHESTECVNYLIQKGVSKDIIFREWSSYDTIANAFFSFTNHIFFSNYKNIGIITSEFHIERTREIFDWVYNLTEKKYNLEYIPVTDFGLDENIIKIRKKREKKSKENILILKEKIKTMKDFIDWLYKEHNAYNNNFLYSEEISKECKNTY
jgi:hypothetical protein